MKEDSSERAQLSDEEIYNLVEPHFGPDRFHFSHRRYREFARAVIAADRATRDASPSDALKPRWVKRDSDFSVTVVFASCRLASEFERQMISAGGEQARATAPVSVAVDRPQCARNR
jgi:hypothetical protein